MDRLMRETKGVQKVQLELCLVRVQVWDLVNSRLFKLKTQTQLVQKGLQLFSLLNCKGCQQNNKKCTNNCVCKSAKN